MFSIRQTHRCIYKIPKTLLWCKQCKTRRCWDVKLSPRKVSKDTQGVVKPHK